MNCLKNLYALAESNKSEKIQKTILELSNYLRYMLRDSSSLILISDEILNVKNYLSLQQQSSARSISYDIDLAEDIANYYIPPFSILAFVENSLKHGIQDNHLLMIQIKVELTKIDEIGFIYINIFDNGPGFSQETILELNKDTCHDKSGKYIGIQNVKNRIRLLYNEKASIIFSNILGSGACIELYIPTEINNK